MKRKITSLVVLFCVMMLALSGCVVQDVTSVGSINGTRILLGEYKFYLDLAMNDAYQKMSSEDQQKLVSGDESVWEEAEIEGKKAGEWVKEEAFNNLVKLKIENLKASEEGIEVTADDKAVIESYKQSYYQYYGNADNFRAFLQSKNLTESDFDKMLTENFISQKYQNKVKEDITVDEAKVSEIYKNEYISAKHILISLDSFREDSEETDGASEEANEKSDEELYQLALNKAQDVLAQYNSGAVFEDLISQYNDDPGQTDEGYVFAEGKMVTEFYEGAKKLQVGEVSEPIKTSFGYHIIKRYDLPYSGTQYDNAITEIKERLKSEEYEKQLEEWKKDYKIEKNEKEISKVKLTDK